MAQKIFGKLKKWITENIDWKMVFFLLVIALAIFLRIWHFNDWLFFKMDQARDAFTAKQAFEQGSGWLPLLGPKAGGTKLNLGPVFYYFQYFATVLFQSVSPSVMAYPDLLFSILSIPLFYLLLKKYFSRNWSILIASAYGLCFLGIEYSRFAWNPNSLPFFNLLFILSLLNVFDETKKYRLRWIVLAAISFSISTQLHFLSFLTLPLITLIFLFFERKELGKYLDWKKIALFLGIVLIFYAPVIFHEAVTHGRNSEEFLKALDSKSTKHTWLKKITRDAVYFGENWLIILTARVGKTKQELPALIAWLLFIIPGLFLNIRNLRKEREPRKKKFLLITLSWFMVYFLVYIPIAYEIRPRFFLPLLMLPFIFIGYISQFFNEFKGRWKLFGVAAAFTLPALIILANLRGTYKWFGEIQEAQKKPVYPKRTIILKARDGIVLWHLENSAKYIAESCPQKNVYLNTSSEYHRPMKYLLGLEGKNILALSDLEKGDADKCIFAVKRTRAKSSKLGNDLDDEFSVSGEKKFGAWMALDLKLKEEFLGKPLPSFRQSRQTSTESEDFGRVYWKDIFSLIERNNPPKY